MSVSLTTLDSRFEPYARALVEVAREYGLQPRVTSTYRSLREQAALYKRFIEGRHPLPVAPPGRSKHNYGLAIDLVCSNEKWLGSVWRYWGGNWWASDPVHFEAR